MRHRWLPIALLLLLPHALVWAQRKSTSIYQTLVIANQDSDLLRVTCQFDSRIKYTNRKVQGSSSARKYRVNIRPGKNLVIEMEGSDGSLDRAWVSCDRYQEKTAGQKVEAQDMNQFSYGLNRLLDEDVTTKGKFFYSRRNPGYVEYDPSRVVDPKKQEKE